MLAINSSATPVYGKSYDGSYLFRIRKAVKNEATLHEFDGLTIDVIIFTVTDQPRAIIATPIAAINTYKRDDARFINKAEWERAVTRFMINLTNNNNE